MTENLKPHEKVAHLAAKGLSRSEIAKVLNMHPMSIAYHCKKRGIRTVTKVARTSRSESAKGFAVGSKRQFAVRLEPSAYEALSELARQNGVSLERQVRSILEQWVAA